MVWQRTEVDGVPAYWVEDDGDLRAYLVFRVGAADEQLAMRGITHVIEHLAMYSVEGPVHASNGQVDPVTTVFATKGRPEDVVAFLTGICRSLRALPFDRLEIENRILRTEADGRSSSVAGPLMLWRYGAATYGLPSYEEFGIGRHTPEQITAWAGRWFTRRNAILVFAGGPPPAGLTLDLPDGERIAPPAPSSALPRTPAYFFQQSNVVAMGTVVDRSTTAPVYTRLLGTRLQRTLRHETGLSYSPATSYDPRDGQVAHVTALADGLPENHAKLVPAFVRELELLAERPATLEEITEVTALLRTAKRESPMATAFANARRELLGAEPLSDATHDAELGDVDPESVRATAATALESALLMLPGGEPPRGFREAPQTSTGVVDGQVLRSVDGPSRLIIGADGVSLVRGPRYLTVRFAHCEVMLAWPDGARRLIGRDGFVLTVEPALWANGSSLPARLDGAVPSDRVITMPPRAAGEIPAAKPSRYTRARARFKHR